MSCRDCWIAAIEGRSVGEIPASLPPIHVLTIMLRPDLKGAADDQSTTTTPSTPAPPFRGIASRPRGRAVCFGFPGALAPLLATRTRREFFGLHQQLGEGYVEPFGDEAEITPRLVELAAFDLFQLGRRHFAPGRQIVPVHAAPLADDGDGLAPPLARRGLLFRRWWAARGHSAGRRPASCRRARW